MRPVQGVEAGLRQLRRTRPLEVISVEVHDVGQLRVPTHVPEDVRDWPYEAISTTIERGTIGDWAVLTREIGRDPWGTVARQVEDYLEYADEPGVASLFRRRITAARTAAERAERDQVAERVRELVQESGLTQEAFARAIGTSRPRLSTYRTGKVTPSAALLLRMERVAAERAHAHAPRAGG